MNFKWQKFVISVSLFLTLYNTIPSAIYYSKPLISDKILNDNQNLQIIHNQLLKNDNLINEFIYSLSDELKVSYPKIQSWEKSAKILSLEFKNAKERELFEQSYQKAISFFPIETAKCPLLFSEESHVYLLKSYDTTAFLASRSSQNNSYFKIDFEPVFSSEFQSISHIFNKFFTAKSEELKRENYPLVTESEFSRLSLIEKEACMVLSASKNFSKIRITLKNFQKLASEYEKSSGLEAKNFKQDAKSLLNLLTQLKFKPLNEKNENDLVFELTGIADNFFKIANEKGVNFKDQFAFIEKKSYADQIRYLNTMDEKHQNDLLNWKEAYAEASFKMREQKPSFITEPKTNLFFSNIALSVKKLFRGDAKNTLKFGLDLSGGKNVLIELLDHSGKKISDPAEIKQGINELYDRVNRLGISDVAIRQEGDFISLDFPGSQNLSANELVSGSSMQFHVVNEQFSTLNPQNAPFVEEFLKEVWEEVSYSKKTDPITIQKIAFRKFYQNPSHAAIVLKENGLNLADPEKDNPSSIFDKTLSKIAFIKSEKSHAGTFAPLMIVFNNFALEGVALKNIGISYDPSKGNFLNFSVSNDLKRNNLSSNPQESFFTWTNAFSKKGAKKEEIANSSRGWRMAVILNGEIVNSPYLESGLKESASITGSFTQKELLKLKNDLQAGSLSFQPKIVMEHNVAPELGNQDKSLGLTSMLISLVLVSALMIYYYRFSGIVATFALLINLLMLIAACVYFSTTLSLASIAGIVLTLGMAVDANILVFERIREELKNNLPLKDALALGYKKAFSAIIDSNLTTMIAAAVLLNFNAGPVKGFALTLLVGLVTSVFTALFMTKTYFYTWVEKTAQKTLKFSSWITNANFNFLAYAKKAVIFSLFVVLAGTAALIQRKSEFFGMDFKGGLSLDIALSSSDKNTIDSESVLQAFIKKGLKPSQVSCRTKDTTGLFKVFLDKDVEEMKPKNESWASFISSALSNEKIVLKESSIEAVDNRMTKVSGQLSDSMKNQALIGLSIALIAIFAYIVIRFEWAYALAATLGLIHDVLFSCALMFILAYFGVPVLFDMTAIAAILTIIGYSLNDTIIVFDRVREERKNHKEKSLSKIVELSLNTTLSRTLLTSLTTLIVLVPMVILGNGALFNFSCIMTIGVIFGTLSTWYLASPLLLKFIKEKTI